MDDDVPVVRWSRIADDPRGRHIYAHAMRTVLSTGEHVVVHVSDANFHPDDVFDEFQAACSPVYLEDADGAFHPLALRGPGAMVTMLPARPAQSALLVTGDHLVIVGSIIARAELSHLIHVVDLRTGVVSLCSAPNVPARYHAMGFTAVPQPGRESPLLLMMGGGYSSSRTTQSTLDRVLALDPLAALAAGSPGFAPSQASLIEYDVTGPAPRPRLYNAICTVRSTHVFLFGGAPDAKNTTAADEVFDDAWMLNTTTRRWRQITREAGAEWPAPRGSVHLHFSDPWVFMLGGFDGSQSITELWAFDVDREQWFNLGIPAEHAADVGLWAYESVLNPATRRLRVAGGVRSDRDTEGTAARFELQLPKPHLFGTVAAFIGRNASVFHDDLANLLGADADAPSGRLNWLIDAVLSSAPGSA